MRKKLANSVYVYSPLGNLSVASGLTFLGAFLFPETAYGTA
jgi:hypothetical protein